MVKLTILVCSCIQAQRLCLSRALELSGESSLGSVPERLGLGLGSVVAVGVGRALNGLGNLAGGVARVVRGVYDGLSEVGVGRVGDVLALGNGTPAGRGALLEDTCV